jgi:hypothetical protein
MKFNPPAGAQAPVCPNVFTVAAPIAVVISSKKIVRLIFASAGIFLAGAEPGLLRQLLEAYGMDFDEQVDKSFKRAPGDIFSSGRIRKGFFNVASRTLC